MVHSLAVGLVHTLLSCPRGFQWWTIDIHILYIGYQLWQVVSRPAFVAFAMLLLRSYPLISYLSIFPNLFSSCAHTA